ncbi:MarR family transcriptional regulator [uncultured Intestinimonas sp.]|uniref:MarR family winged helix-turn-helix transcriptional regulator n=1 Tax=uncultured Intestinimonas sp. TaxID=1689265 RepID=UPI0025F40D3E|nr:MarR family transcriptional regulator [uncultured Intestinimonas sp.]
MNGSIDILMTYLRVSQHMSRLFRSHFGRLQLTFPQALVLNVLGEEGPLPISSLAERTGSANSTVSGIVDRLEKLELARRVRSGEDRRVIYVAVTDKYQSLRERAEANVGGYFDSVLSTMTAEDRDMVARALLRLDEALLAKERAGEQFEEEEGL